MKVEATPARLFVSYSEADQSFVTNLVNRFRAAGVPTFAFGDCNGIGDVWQDQVLKALSTCEVMLCVMTPTSVESRWVHAEIGAAWALKDKVVAPVLLNVGKERLIEILQNRIYGDASSHELETEVFNKVIRTHFRDVQAPDVQSNRGEIETFSPRTHIDTQPIGHWWPDKDGRMIKGEGEFAYILSKKYYRPPFRVRAVMRFCDFRSRGGSERVNAGVMIGWSNPNDRRCYYNICMNEKNSFFELVGHRGADEYVDYEHFSEDQPFAIKQDVNYDFDISVTEWQADATIKGADGSDAKMTFQAPAPTPATAYPGFAGYVGVRPWRSRVEIEQFEITA